MHLYRRRVGGLNEGVRRIVLLNRQLLTFLAT
jgi:hypothetical protein